MVVGETRVLQGGAWRRRERANLGGSLVERADLPFDMPTAESLAASERMAFAHYFLPYPISLNNEAIIGGNPMLGSNGANPGDYHQRRWLPPGEVEGTTDHGVYGGYIRDRKIGIGTRPKAGTSNAVQVADKEKEIGWAKTIGLDGFSPDILSITIGGQRWTQFLELLDAIENYQADTGDLSFKLYLMPDGTTGGTSNATTLADRFASIANSPALYRFPDGRLGVFPYMPERAPAGAGSGGATAVAFWTTFRDRMAALGHPVHMWFCYTRPWTDAAQAPSFNAIAYGHGRWGDRYPNASGADTTSARGAPQYNRNVFPGKKWLHYAAPQDVRPYVNVYWDSWCSENLRASWNAAIDGNADAVQIPTWDDLTEGSSIAPTYGGRWVWADICSYYLVRFKLGYWPTIARDAVFLIHRTQNLTGMTYTGGQTTFMVRNGSNTHTDVEALCWLTEPATVQILNNGSVIHTTAADAGLVSVKTTQPTSGTLSAKIIRSSVTVVDHTSPHTISTTAVSQDTGYKASSSLREPLDLDG